jgi:hypothetical protein
MLPGIKPISNTFLGFIAEARIDSRRPPEQILWQVVQPVATNLKPTDFVTAYAPSVTIASRGSVPAYLIVA